MFLSYIFLASGIGIAILLFAKRIEEKKKTRVFLIKLISRGEERARQFHGQTIKYYSHIKEQTHLFLTKQLPRYSRNFLNKLLTYLEEKANKYFERLRDSRLLKKEKGVSEFFKSMSEVEKGNGQINEEVYVEEPTNDQQLTAKPKKARKKREKKIIVTEEV